jgi:hypothetical protein
VLTLDGIDAMRADLGEATADELFDEAARVSTLTEPLRAILQARKLFHDALVHMPTHPQGKARIAACRRSIEELSMDTDAAAEAGNFATLAERARHFNDHIHRAQVPYQPPRPVVPFCSLAKARQTMLEVLAELARVHTPSAKTDFDVVTVSCANAHLQLLTQFIGTGAGGLGSASAVCHKPRGAVRGVLSTRGAVACLGPRGASCPGRRALAHPSEPRGVVVGPRRGRVRMPRRDGEGIVRQRRAQAQDDAEDGAGVLGPDAATRNESDYVDVADRTLTHLR